MAGCTLMRLSVGFGSFNRVVGVDESWETGGWWRPLNGVAWRHRWGFFCLASGGNLDDAPSWWIPAALLTIDQQRAPIKLDLLMSSWRAIHVIQGSLGEPGSFAYSQNRFPPLICIRFQHGSFFLICMLIHFDLLGQSLGRRRRRRRWGRWGPFPGICGEFMQNIDAMFAEPVKFTF